MKAVSVKVRGARREDIDRIVEIERSWVHLSHWSIDAYRRLVNEDSFYLQFCRRIRRPGRGLVHCRFCDLPPGGKHV